MKTAKNSTTFNAIFMVAATLCAKVCGMLRDILLAAMYGTQTAEAIAFSSASRIPVLFFDIAFGSAVTSAFIPVFNEYLTAKGKDCALKLANNFINLVFWVSALLSALGIVFSSQLVNIIAGGYDSDIQGLISSLVIILFPMIIFTGLSFCVVGILQSFEQFIIPSLISLVSNGFLIIYLVVFGNRFGVRGVAYAMLVAWSLQLIVQLPSLWKVGYRFKPVFGFKDSGISKICMLALPIILSSWVQPINNLINIRLASGLAEQGSVASLDYANRLYIILVSVFAYAVTNLIFPSLSRAYSDNDNEKFSSIASGGIRYALLVIVPVMMGFLVLARPIVQLFYERGQFDSHSTYLTSTALFFYSLGMVGYALQEIANRVFYAMQDGKTPMIISVSGITLNILLSIFLINVIGGDHRALALSASVAANAMGFSALGFANHRSRGIVNKEFVLCFVKILISSVVMMICVIILDRFFAAYSPVIRVALGGFVGAVVYFVCTYLLGVHEVREIANKLIKNKNVQ